MILIDNTSSADTFTITATENLNKYGLTGSTGQTFYFTFTSDWNGVQINSELTDISPSIWRFNQFEINGNLFSATTGQYTYECFANSGRTQTLEIGRLLVSGITTNSIYL